MLELPPLEVEHDASLWLTHCPKCRASMAVPLMSKPELQPCTCGTQCTWIAHPPNTQLCSYTLLDGTLHSVSVPANFSHLDDARFSRNILGFKACKWTEIQGPIHSWAGLHSQRKLPKYSCVQDCVHETMDELPLTINSRARHGLELCRHRVIQNAGDSKTAEMANGWHWLVWPLIGPCLFLEKRFTMPQSHWYFLPKRSLFTGQLLHMQHGLVV